MRELKFRCWDVLESKFVHDDHFIYGELADQAMNNPEKSEYYILLQYTGLKDRKGNEIYDGDILSQTYSVVDDYTREQSEKTQFLVVRWDNENARWSVYCPEAVNNKNWGYIPTKTELIGNIYQNPLLQVAPK